MTLELGRFLSKTEKEPARRERREVLDDVKIEISVQKRTPPTQVPHLSTVRRYV